MNDNTHRPDQHRHRHTINTIITLMCARVCVQCARCIVYNVRHISPVSIFFRPFQTDRIDFVCMCISLSVRIMLLSQFEIWLQWCWLHLNTLQFYYYLIRLCQWISVVMGQTTCKLPNQSDELVVLRFVCVYSSKMDNIHIYNKAYVSLVRPWPSEKKNIIFIEWLLRWTEFWSQNHFRWNISRDRCSLWERKVRSCNQSSRKMIAEKLWRHLAEQTIENSEEMSKFEFFFTIAAHIRSL